MAERLGYRLTRSYLKEILSSRDRLYSFLAPLSRDIPKVDDDFVGPTLDANKWAVGNGGGAGAASPAIDVGVVNGAVKLVTGTAGDGTADSFLSSGRHFRGDQNAIFLARLTSSAITSVKIECGFNDALAGTTSHIVNVKATPTFVATDGVCWIFDTNDGARGWDGLGVANAVVATRMTQYNVVPVAATYETLGIALLDGLAYFMHWTADGTMDFSTFRGDNSSAAMSGAVTKTVLLTPHVSIESRNATSKTLDVDYIYAYQARTNV